MRYYAVHYTYVDDPELIARHRPAHREYLSSLTALGLVAAGAYPDADVPGALLIFTADDAEAVAELLVDDPFRTNDVISARHIEYWTPVIGVFAEQ